MRLKVFCFDQELISSPPGGKHSQSDSPSESSPRNNQEKPGESNLGLGRTDKSLSALTNRSFLQIQTLWMTRTQNCSRRVKFSTFAVLWARSTGRPNAVAQWRCSAPFNAALVFQVCTRGHGIWSWLHNTLRAGWRYQASEASSLTQWHSHLLGFCVSGGNSQFSFLELSQSQDLGGEVTNCQEEEDNITPQPDCEKHAISGILASCIVLLFTFMGDWSQMNIDPSGCTFSKVLK